MGTAEGQRLPSYEQAGVETKKVGDRLRDEKHFQPLSRSTHKHPHNDGKRS